MPMYVGPSSVCSARGFYEKVVKPRASMRRAAVGVLGGYASSFARIYRDSMNRKQNGRRVSRPSNWLRLDTTVELSDEISKSSKSRNKPPVRATHGRHGRAFVVRELVYAYAMWLSAAFQLR